eukprot:4761906-Pleurochrysis_carterae.AAC.5
MKSNVSKLRRLLLAANLKVALDTCYLRVALSSQPSCDLGDLAFTTLQTSLNAAWQRRAQNDVSVHYRHF